MLEWIRTNKTLLSAGIIVTAVIPVLIISYEVLIKGKESVQFSFDTVAGLVIILYYLLLIILAIGFSLRWIVGQIIVIRRLKNEKIKTELLHLKAQVNPHFFFNMLNNLYGWIDKDPSIAKDLVLKLSEMMRYSIYDGQKDMVNIKEEISFLKNYIQLHQIRYHKKIQIDFSIDLQHREVKVMPLLFIILVENAFKHGVETLRENAFVKMDLKTTSKEIIFEIKNNFEKEDPSSKGIGLQNLRRRLKIMYPNNHKLVTSNTDNVFTALLTLNFSQ